VTVERPISEDDLQAFLDGVLEESRRDAVARYLDVHPEAKARLVTYWPTNPCRPN